MEQESYYGDISPLITDTPEHRQAIYELIDLLHREVFMVWDMRNYRAREDKAFNKDVI